jgi:hypothetical protein
LVSILAWIFASRHSIICSISIMRDISTRCNRKSCN